MKILINILIVVVVIITIPLILAIFTAKEYSVTRAAVIDKPSQDIFNYVKLLKNQEHYSKWVKQDPAAGKIFTGTDGTVGCIYAWDSENKNSGKGEQEIKKIIDGQMIEQELRFEKPFEGIAHTQMTTEPLGASQTKVQWSMAGKNPYPMNLMNLFMDSMLGKDMEASLIDLKTLMER